MRNALEKVVFHVNHVPRLDKIVYFSGNKNLCTRNKPKQIDMHKLQ